MSEQARRMKTEIAELTRFDTPETYEKWRNRTTGPNWPTLRRYVMLVKVAREQAEYIEELEETIKEMDGETR